MLKFWVCAVWVVCVGSRWVLLLRRYCDKLPIRIYIVEMSISARLVLR